MKRNENPHKWTTIGVRPEIRATLAALSSMLGFPQHDIVGALVNDLYQSVNSNELVRYPTLFTLYATRQPYRFAVQQAVGHWLSPLEDLKRASCEINGEPVEVCVDKILEMSGKNY